MATIVGGTGGSRSYLVKVDRAIKAVDNSAGAAAVVLDKVAVATALSLGATDKITRLLVIGKSDNGVDAVTFKASANSDAVAIYPNGERFVEGQVQADSTVEEVDNFTVTVPIGAVIEYHVVTSKTTSGAIAN
jgi:hypothetical protein